MATVYLETSFFSACVSTKTSQKIAGWRASSNEWWETRRSDHELFISSEVLAELSDPQFANRDRALKLLEGLTMMDITPEIEQFAELLVTERLMPGPSVSGDALHVAVATMYQMDYILTWNVKHLANPNKRTHLAVICMRGLGPAYNCHTGYAVGETTMPSTESPDARGEESPVDEVRRVRERRHQETGGDIHKLVERSRAAVDKYRDQLKLKSAPPPSSNSRRDGTRG